MQICHVSPHLPPDQAANALLPAELGRLLAARGDAVCYVAHEPAQQRDDGQPAASIPNVRWIPRRRRTAIGRVLKTDAWRLVRDVRAALTETARHADLLHLHSNGLIIEAAAAWARRHGIPYVLTVYGTEIWHYKKRWPVDPFTSAYRRAAHVAFYSQRLLAQAHAVGLDRPSMSVIYPAVAPSFVPCDAEARAAWRRRLGVPEPRLIVNVKRLHPLAGQTFLIDAFAEICRTRDDVRLVICGDGPLRSELLGRAQALGVANRVTFTGLIPNQLVAGYMAAADVFALPSLLEALPTVAIEALACGTPVVSADHPGGVELNGLFDGDVVVVPRKSVPVLARSLTDILDRPRRTTPHTARTLATRFSPTAVLRAYDAVYQDAIGRRT